MMADKKYKIVILNAQPLNTGDAALLESLLYGLEQTVSIERITVVCDDVEVTKSKYPSYHFIQSIEKSSCALAKGRLLYIRKFLRLLMLEKYIVKLLPLSFFTKYYTIMKECDFIVLAPGGYFNPSYQNQDRMTVMSKIQKHNKPILILGQSIGPLDNTDYIHKSIITSLKKLPLIVAREHITFEWLSNNHFSNIHCTQDLAFLLYRKYNDQLSVKKKSEVKAVAINFRTWRDKEEEIVKKAITLCDYLTNKDIAITFLSTCQGIGTYVDDSKLALKVYSKLTNKNLVSLDTNSYTPVELLHRYADFDLYIGMRLHGAILSMIGGTVAVNIGYEDKTPGIYQAMDNYAYTDFETPVSIWINKVEETIQNFVSEQRLLDSRVEDAATKAMNTFSILKNYIDGAS